MNEYDIIISPYLSARSYLPLLSKMYDMIISPYLAVRSSLHEGMCMMSLSPTGRRRSSIYREWENWIM